MKITQIIFRSLWSQTNELNIQNPKEEPVQYPRRKTDPLFLRKTKIQKVQSPKEKPDPRTFEKLRSKKSERKTDPLFLRKTKIQKVQSPKEKPDPLYLWKNQDPKSEIRKKNQVHCSLEKHQDPKVRLKTFHNPLKATENRLTKKLSPLPLRGHFLL